MTILEQLYGSLTYAASNQTPYRVMAKLIPTFVGSHYEFFKEKCFLASNH